MGYITSGNQIVDAMVVVYRLCMAVVTIIRCILVAFGQTVLKSM